jgi:transposase
MYKAQGNSGKVSKVGQFFPSAGLCSDCGEMNGSLTLSVRPWVCLVCGAVHDRDENAGIHILDESTGGAPESNALGSMIPVRESAQEAHCL